MTAIDHHKNPFDQGRLDSSGEARWSARWLMGQMGYDKWQNFESVIIRAQLSASNQGHNVFHLFTESSKKTGGRPKIDFLVTRFAAYLIAMNGDPHKPEVAAAQAYFAIRTREAEVAQELEDSDPLAAIEAANLRSQQAVEIAKRERAARLEAESWAKELEPFAATQLALAEADGDYGVADAAKILSRDPNIEIGEQRLFSFMAEIKWVYRESGRWRPYQTAIKSGVLAMLQEGKPFWHEGKQKMMLSVPPVRITGDGLGVLHRKLGGHAESPRIVEGPK